MQSLAALLVKQSDIIASWPRRDVLQAPLRFVVIDAARLPRLLSAAALALKCCPHRRNISFIPIRAKTRQMHAGRSASMRRTVETAPPSRGASVAHTTLGWHCCSPERRGPEGTEVTRAIEKWSQRSLSLLVCAGGHLWPPRGARRVVHAPRVRRPSPLKALEAAQG